MRSFGFRWNTDKATALSSPSCQSVYFLSPCPQGDGRLSQRPRTLGLKSGHVLVPLVATKDCHALCMCMAYVNSRYICIHIYIYTYLYNATRNAFVLRTWGRTWFAPICRVGGSLGWLRETQRNQCPYKSPKAHVPHAAFHSGRSHFRGTNQNPHCFILILTSFCWLT